MIGIVIPGVPIVTGGPLTQTNVVADVNNPASINNLTLFLTGPLPEGYGAALYFSVPPYNSLEFIGCVANERPSDVFYTSWSLNPTVNCCQQIKLCVKMESLTNLKMAFEEKIKVDLNQEFAKRVAKNLFNYLDSFNQNQDPNRQLLVVPLNSLQGWYDKFLQKYKMDPNFLMKTDI